MVGQVLYGINNIYTVLVNDRHLQCRIKGKILKTERKFYNPIAVGDYVEIQPDPISPDVGWIVQRQDRKSSFIRWNKKRKASQVIAANADLLVCMSSVQSPPFRPRFIDRLLVSADLGNLTPVILLNKCDLGLNRAVKERLRAYQDMGYQVIRCSAVSGKGVSQVKQLIRNKVTIFAGQSGVGKSTLLNFIDPKLNLTVGEISSKHNRGIHTTNYSVMVAVSGWNSSTVIDTPGIREFEIAGLRSEELHHFFRDFSHYTPLCGYYACRHIDEPNCAVREALKENKIHPDRYEGYLRLYYDLKESQKEMYGSSFD